MVVNNVTHNANATLDMYLKAITALVVFVCVPEFCLSSFQLVHAETMYATLVNSATVALTAMLNANVMLAMNLSVLPALIVKPTLCLFVEIIRKILESSVTEELNVALTVYVMLDTLTPKFSPTDVFVRSPLKTHKSTHSSCQFTNFIQQREPHLLVVTVSVNMASSVMEECTVLTANVILDISQSMQ